MDTRRTIVVRGLAVGLAALVFSAVSLWSIHQYRYGDSQHAVILPFLKEALDSGLYPGDYLLREAPYYYTFLWHGLGWLVARVDVDLPVLFFAAYALSVFATFVAAYVLAMLLFDDRRIAFLTLYFLLFANPTALAWSATLDTAFVERVAARPLLLFAVAAYLKRLDLLSFLLLGLAFLIHPLTAAFVIGPLVLLAILEREEIGLRRLAICAATLALFASPILVWRAVSAPADASHMFTADPGWLSLLRLRSSHHLFPLDWDKHEVLRFALVLALFVTGWRFRPEARRHRVVRDFSLAVVGMWIVGTVFVELWPVALVVQLQLFRSSSFLLYFAFAYWASYVVRTVVEGEDRPVVVPVLMASWIVFFGATHWWHAFLAFLVLGGAAAAYRWRFARVLPDGPFSVALVALVVVVGVVVGLDRPGVTLRTAQDPEWLDVEEWARRETDVSDAFIVPPNAIGFRGASERTIYGDWKDGTQMFFNPDFGREWIRRMRVLGYEPSSGVEGLENLDRLERAYARLDEPDLREIAAELRTPGRKIYAVLGRGVGRWAFPVAYSNEELVVYEVPAG